MPILDIQTRFRELGRIRTGIKVPTRGGKMRPEKLPRFRLTSPWQHLIEQAADVFGGTARPWSNDGAEEFEVIVDVESLPVVIPPGEVLDQWYELWTGGGCQRRCDGKRQVLVDRPCACPEDPLERQDLAGTGKACKPTTRLRLMLPDVADVGIWRLESHGFHAAAELGGAVGLVEAATRSGALIPADLRLAAREGSRRPGQPGKKFFVPAISFRGTLGPTLDALGILGEGATMPRILGVEARPEITSGGHAALPSGKTAFDPAPTEEASFPPPMVPPSAPQGAPVDQGPAEVPVDEPRGFAPPPPQEPATEPLGEPEAFVPPPAPPADEEGDGPAYSGPQIIAMRFQEHGIKDRAHRLRLAGAIIGREISSGNDLRAPEIRAVLEVLGDPFEFATLLGQHPAPDGDEDLAEKLEASLPPADPAPAPEVLHGELVDEPSAHRRRRPVAPPEAPPEAPAERPAPSPEEMNGDQWRTYLAERGVKVTELMREATRLGRLDTALKVPGVLDEVKASGMAADLIGFVEDLAERRRP